MIELTKLSGKKFLVNCELITYIESCGDTRVTLSNGDHLLVLESSQEVHQKITSYKKSIFFAAK